MYSLPILQCGWQVFGHSRKLSPGSSDRGLLVCCVEWSPAGESLTNPLLSIGVAVTERRTLSPSFLGRSPAALFAAETSPGWSLRAGSTEYLGPQNARDLGWWRHAQAAHARSKDKWSGVHNQRFDGWRWETPPEAFYGSVRRQPSAAVTNKALLLKTQDREVEERRLGFRSAARQFPVCRRCQPPSRAVFSAGLQTKKI